PRDWSSDVCSSDLDYPITLPDYPITRLSNRSPLALGDRDVAECLAVDRIFGERLVHLVPALLRPVHFLLRRRVPLVLRRVVVVPDAENLAAGRNVERLFELVLDLPVEVGMR